jgi:cytochrome c-type biogenesis protein CcmH
VIRYLVSRYGVFVLLDPPFMPVTYLLWLVPPVLFLGAGALLFLRARRGRGEDTVPALSPEERARAARLLGERP